MHHSKMVFQGCLAFHRFNEWGKATWLLQMEKLKGEHLARDWRYVAYMDPTESSAKDCTNTLAGQMHAVSWI